MSIEGVHRYATRKEAQAEIDNLITNGLDEEDDSRHAEYGKHCDCDHFVHEIIEYNTSEWGN